MTMIIDIEKFISSLIERSSGITQQIFHSDLLNALKEQGLEYKNGEIVKTQRRIAAEAKEAIFDDEDERIKRDIIRILKGEIGYTSKEDTDKYVAWLEKQESVREIVERCKTSWYNEGKIAGMAEGLTDDEKYQQGWHDALEKQGKQKPPVIDFKANNWYVSKVNGKIYDMTYNPIDNIEPAD